MKRIRKTLIDTTYDYTLNEVNEFLEANDNSPLDNDCDNDFWEVVSHLRELDCEDFWDNVKYSKEYGEDAYAPCIIVGHCGCWDGRHDIVPVKTKNLYEALRKCADGMWDIKVEQNCSKIEFCGLHHDGRNYFDIYFLNQRGEEAYDRWDFGSGQANLEHRIYHKTLTDYLW